MYFWTFALFVTAKSVFSGSCLSVILLPLTLMIVTTKFATVDGWNSDIDCHPAMLEPSKTCEPTVMLSTQNPAGFVSSAPNVSGSLYERNCSAIVCPAYGARLQVTCCQPLTMPVKPGTFAFAVGSAPGSVVAVVYGGHDRLVYDAPPSVETWTKPKAPPAPSFPYAAEDTRAPPPGRTGTAHGIVAAPVADT